MAKEPKAKAPWESEAAPRVPEPQTDPAQTSAPAEEAQASETAEPVVETNAVAPAENETAAAGESGQQVDQSTDTAPDTTPAEPVAAEAPVLSSASRVVKNYETDQAPLAVVNLVAQGVSLAEARRRVFGE